MPEFDNLLGKKTSNDYYDQSCWIDGWMFLIFRRISMILYFLEYPAIPNILKYKVLEGLKFVPKYKASQGPLDKKHANLLSFGAEAEQWAQN